MQQNDELKHYGVLGMRWHIHKGQYDKAYEKASKKLTKLDAKYNKLQDKAIKQREIADKASNGLFKNAKKAAKYDAKSRATQQKAMKAVKKADKWVKEMNKAFKNTPISLTTEQQLMGRDYAQTLRMQQMLRVNR